MTTTSFGRGFRTRAHGLFMAALGLCLLLLHPFAPPAAAAFAIGPICIAHRGAVGFDPCTACCAFGALLLGLGTALLLGTGRRSGGLASPRAATPGRILR